MYPPFASDFWKKNEAQVLPGLNILRMVANDTGL